MYILIYIMVAKKKVNKKAKKAPSGLKSLGKKKNSALWNGEFGGSFRRIETTNTDVLVLLRENGEDRVLGVFNLSSDAADISIRGDDLQGKYRNAITSEEIGTEGKLKLTLGGWGYKVLESRGGH